MTRVEAAQMRVGVVGAGEISFKVHLPIVSALPGLTPTWICDRNTKRAEAVARAFATRPTSTVNASVLASTDLVLLAIPLGARDAYYDELAGHPRCAVLVEKPFARSSAHHREIVGRFSPSRLGVMLQRRMWAPGRTIADLVSRGVFGRLEGVRYGFGGPRVVVGSSYNADPRLACGGILLDSGVHGLDLIVHCLGVTGITIDRSRIELTNSMDVHTEAVALLTVPGHGVVPCTIVASGLQHVEEGFTFECEHATLRMSFAERGVHVRPVGSAHEYAIDRLNGTHQSLTNIQCVHAQWLSFLDMVASGVPNATSARSAMLTTQFIEGIYQAAGVGAVGSLVSA